MRGKRLINYPKHMMIKSITSTTEAQKKEMKIYTNSRLTDLAMCPTWGVIHQQKKYKTDARAMALEAGSAMHEVFASIRLWQVKCTHKLPQHAEVNGIRLFGKDRWTEINKAAKSKDQRENLLEMAYAALHTSSFEDSDTDETRTRANMELATTVYADERLKWLMNWPIYIEDGKDPNSMCGVEHAFDVVITYGDNKKIRYAGTIDGCVVKTQTGTLHLEENKTAVRLDVGWRAAFEMSYQVTGYNACSTVLYGKPVFKSRITGLKIKPSGRHDDIWVAELSRDAASIVHWGSYVRTMVELSEKFIDDVEHAPRFTHSCNRFFRPCSMLTFCTDTPQGRVEQWEQMVPSDLSPTEVAVGE